MRVDQEDLEWSLQAHLGAAIHQLGAEPIAPGPRAKWIARAIGYAPARADVMAPRQLDLYWHLVEGLEPGAFRMHSIPIYATGITIPHREAAKFHVGLDRLERSATTTRGG